MSITLKFFKAGCGDAISIRHESEDSSTDHQLFIDAGFKGTYGYTLGPEIQFLVDNGMQADLCILTHTDRDHINGLFEAINQFGTAWVRDIWFNHSPIEPRYFPIDRDVVVGVKQGIEFRDLLQQQHVLANKIIVSGLEINIGAAKITVLSPDEQQYSKWIDYWKKQEQELDTEEASGNLVAKKRSDYKQSLRALASAPFKEDNSFSNRSSIAVLYEVSNFRALYMGDAHPSVVCQSIRDLGFHEDNPLNVDIFKLSHHGASGSTSDELLNLIRCRNYVISTNGWCYNLPNKQTFARILSSPNYSQEEPVRFLFNYSSDEFPELFSEDDQESFKFECLFTQTIQNALILHIDESSQPANITFS